MKLAKDIRKPAFASALAKGFAASAGLAFTWSVGRLLGSAGAGQILVALTVLTIVSSLGRVGFDAVVTREVAAASDDATVSAVLLHAVRVASIATLVLSSVVWITMAIVPAWSVSSGRGAVIAVVLIGSVATSGRWLISHAFQGEMRLVRFHMYQNALVVGIGTAVFVFLIAIGASVSPLGAACIFLAATALAYLIGWADWRRTRTTSAGEVDTAALDRSSRMLLVGVALTLVEMWSPQLFLAAVASDDEVGLFSVALRLSMSASVILVVMNSVVFPQFATAYENGESERLRQLARLASGVASSVGVAVLIVVVVAGRDILGFVGTDFEEAASMLVILTIGQVVSAVSGSVGGLLAMTRHERDAAVAHAIGASGSLIACVAMVPAFGGVGAAWSRTLGLTVVMLYQAFLVKKRLGFFPMPSVRRMNR